LGRFINRDPIEEQGGFNLYAFVRNNAVNAWDYLGMNPLSEWMEDNLSPPDVPTIAPPSGGYPVDPTAWANSWNGHDDMEYDPRTAMWVPSGSIMRDNIDYMSQANQAIGDVLRLQARAELSGNIQVLGRNAAGDLVVAAFSSDAAALLASIGTTTAITEGMSLADVGALVGPPSASVNTDFYALANAQAHDLSGMLAQNGGRLPTPRPPRAVRIDNGGILSGSRPTSDGPGPLPADLQFNAPGTATARNLNPFRGPVTESVMVVGPRGTIPVRVGQWLTGSPDGRFVQVRNADGSFSGLRLDGPHNPDGHPWPVSWAPHWHVPNVTPKEGSPARIVFSIPGITPPPD
jgi:hypothetical protein